MYDLPKENKDLRRYVLGKDLRRLGLYLLWMALWYGGAMAYNHNHQTYTPDRLMLGWKLFFWMLASATRGFFLFRIYTFFTDRAYQGTILTSGLSQSYEGSKDPGLLKSADYDFRLNTALKLETDRGKRKRLHFEQKNGFYFYYYEGTKVVKFHGLPYPVAVGHQHPNARQYRMCAACGQVNGAKETRCQTCFFTLIDEGEYAYYLLHDVPGQCL